jgi:hypothetical protein
MKRLLILGATLLAVATLPVATSRAESIACAAEVPAIKSGHWYYRIIDGRKCWYQGKAMLPKSSLFWPTSSDTEARAEPSNEPTAKPAAADRQAATPKPVIPDEPTAKPTTDGRSIATPAMTPEPAPSAWPAPVSNEISFESRWLGLKSRN